MKTITHPQSNFIQALKSHICAVILFVALSVPAISSAQTKAALPAVGTHSIIGSIEGIDIEAVVQSPSAEETPLQVACVFEYTENDIYIAPALPAAANGMVHLDKGLNGIITKLRKSGMFAGHLFETLLIDVPNGTISPQKLLLIGLGDRTKFDPEIMKTVGSIGMREALKLGVDNYAHASDLKDGGVDSPTALVIENVLKGAISAYRTEVFLASQRMSAFKPLKKITFLAGQPFYQPSGEALRHAIAANGN